MYVQPTISKLVPDFILIDENRGISILEVKDWSLSYIYKKKEIKDRKLVYVGWLEQVKKLIIHSKNFNKNFFAKEIKNIYESYFEYA